MPTVRLICTHLLKLLCRDGIQGALQLAPQPLAHIRHSLGRVISTAWERGHTRLSHRANIFWRCRAVTFRACRLADSHAA